MAKKLIYNYTFNPGASGVGNIVIEGNHPEKTLLIITNTTDNVIIYNFASSGLGGTTSYNSTTDHTTITLDYNTSSMSSTDSLQIFLDVQEEKIDFSETFVDPVNKFRVSEPQNLIDTDFEYGLQPTKWETIELVNNIPSFYASSSDYTISNIVKVETISGSENITVTTQDTHGLTVGSPIDVQGLSSRTAEGKFLITAVPTTTTFVYKSKGQQSITGPINGTYTTITPGQFYVGSEIAISNSKGVETNGLAPSTLSFDTEYSHGFTPGTSVYITNTVGSQKYNITAAAGLGTTAPDGRPFIDVDDTVSTSLSINSSLTETKQMTGTYAFKFSSSAVNTTDNTITWANHRLQQGDVLLYVPPAGDTAIGGLQRFQIYYVKSAPTANTITLCETTNGDFTNNPIIDITSQGTSSFGRHELILGYEIYYATKSSSSYDSYFYTRNYSTGTGSGRDLIDYTLDTSSGRYGYYGLGGTYPSRVMLTQKSSASPTMSTAIHAAPIYSTRDDANFTFGKSGTSPDGYDFIEDYQRFEFYQYQNNTYNYYNFQYKYIYGLYINNFDYNNGSTQFYNTGTTFIFFLKRDTEQDSFYIENHGLSSGSQTTLTTLSGSNVTNRTETGTFYSVTPTTSTLSSPTTSTVTVVTPNRIKFDAAPRLNTASGTYSLAATVTNPTANSIYIGSNNFVENQTLYLSAETGGGLPTTTSGVANPTLSSIDNVYSSVKTALDSIKTTMSADTFDLIMTGSHQTPFNGGFFTTSGGIQYIYSNRSSMYLTKYGSSSGFFSATGNLTGNFANGTIYDPFSSSTAGGKGYYMISTPFANNGTTPYFIDLFQIPYEAGVQYSQLYYSNWFIYNYATSGTQDNITNTSLITSLGNGWRYTYETNYFSPFGSNSYHGYICMTIVMENSGWPGYYSSSNLNIYYPGSSWMAPYTFGDAGQRYWAHVIIPVKAGTTSSRYGATGSVLTNAQIANTIVSQVANNFNNPSFSGQTNQEVRSNIISGNRVRLKTSSGSTYNFTGFGTSPISLRTAELIGALDGYYSITSTGSTTANIQLNSQVSARTLGLTSSNFVTVGGIVYINYTSHKLKTAQKVVFNQLSSSNSISGLTSGTTYYAAPAGPNYLSLAASPSNASGGNIISIGTTTSGNFNLIAPTISGISSGAGTVGVTSDSKTLTGTGTLFKRFFKAGDTIKIEDESVSPSRYKELTVASVVDDTIITTTEAPGFTDASTSYFVDTKVNVRPDGTFLHRPFDGGVEITAGTSPNSSISRQTRKYFRYQSGKGIQCSLAINFNPSRVATSVVGLGTTATVTTKYPHGLTTSNRVTIRGASDNAYNGSFNIIQSDQFTFKYNTLSTPNLSVPDGIIEYNIDSWANSVIRAGMFDYQNGFFFEFDGSTLYAVRRSSVQQLPGTAKVTKGSNIVLGTDTNFDGQLQVGQYIVLRGNSYRITRLVSNTELHIQPAYRGLGSNDVIITKTIDTRVPQTEWNIDKADGTGPSGFVLDKTKIQMAYLDYSWYGAGKIRFGFKDTYGHVKYMHEFRHNNRLEEAYMRSGNIPGRYEIENVGTPTYVPSLFHWGTSVIMDGRFDDDKAYLFTASSNSLIFTNGASSTATANANSTLTSQYNYTTRNVDWYVRLSFPVADASKFSTGVPLYTSNNQLNGQKVAYTEYSGSSIFVYIFVQSTRGTQPATYPSVTSTTVVNIGAPSAVSSTVDLTKDIPLISIRLAPSVDNNLTGAVGQREIINRMQLQLKSLGMTLSHDCEVDLILNGSITNTGFTAVDNPSLSQLLRHSAGDRIIGGTKIFSLRASGGSIVSSGKRLSNTTDFDLSQITDLGNSILGGDGVFPNGPDLLTIAIVPVDTSEINATTPLAVSSRITWTESQA